MMTRRRAVRERKLVNRLRRMWPRSEALRRAAMTPGRLFMRVSVANMTTDEEAAVRRYIHDRAGLDVPASG
jgi:hypothetical protein